jgi:1-deoxy-D-xylulose-5-phosphate synthase
VEKDLIDSLDTINLKTLNIEKLNVLSYQIRKKIISVLSKNGGHLSSNLGIVDLTIALHYVFNSPLDKFIFDTSHQTYTHKILTNRSEKFHTLRQYMGISGFAHPEESEHDHYYSGHAGTALSIGLGLAKNRDCEKRAEHILPILGDASFTCGLTLEALNNMPSDLTKFILVLNDNKMAISQNVGNIKNILSRLINNPKANNFYNEIFEFLKKIPSLGPRLAKNAKKVKESIKNLVSPAAFFEHFGLSYIGPIDGHDIEKMVDTFEKAKNSNMPVIIHVLTTKGKGMPLAIQNPTPYHGVKPFDIDTGKFLNEITNKKTFPKIFGSEMVKLGVKHKNLFVLTPAMSQGSCLVEFSKKFPTRFMDVGIAEGHCVTYAAGLANKNKNIVFVSIYSTFFLRAFDNVFHDVCMQNLPVIFALDRSSLSGPDGCSHHGIYDISFLNTLPNMVIVQPRNAKIFKEVLSESIKWKKPTAIRYPNKYASDENIEDKTYLKMIEFGKAQILSSTGNDILIVSLGHMYETAKIVQENLINEKNITSTIVDPIFLKPLDEEIFSNLLKSHKMVITIEEHSLKGGLGSIINNFIAVNDFTNILKVKNFGIPDRIIHHGDSKSLLKELSLDSESITKKTIESFEKAFLTCIKK